MNLKLEHDIFNIASDVAYEMKLDAFVVGGYVRDLFLNAISKDIDLVVVDKLGLYKNSKDRIGILFSNNLHKRVKELHQVSSLAEFHNFGTAEFKITTNSDPLIVEIIGARKESYQKDSRKPIVEEGTLEDDQNRRDLTFNAMYVSLNKESFGELYDPFNGLQDIKNKIIRTPVKPTTTFSDDPLRMLRVIRFSTKLKFRIEQETYDAIKNNIQWFIDKVSKERILEEIKKILSYDNSADGIVLLDQLGLLEVIFPDLCKLKGREFREVTIINKEGKEEVIKKSLVRDLKFPIDIKLLYVAYIGKLHGRIQIPKDATDSAKRRLIILPKEYFKEQHIEHDFLHDLIVMGQCDLSTQFEERVQRIVQSYINLFNACDELRTQEKLEDFKPAIDGNEIMEMFNLKPSKIVGTLLNSLREAIMEGLPNTHNEAEEFLMNKAKELKLI